MVNKKMEDKPSASKSGGIRRFGVVVGGGVGVVLIAVIVVLALVLTHKKTITTEWAKIYYDYLTDAAMNDRGKEVGLQKDTTYALSFIKLDNYDQPAMLMRDTSGKRVNVYGIGAENQVDVVVNERQKDNENMAVEYLFDMQREKYDYFLQYKHSKSEVEYISLSEQLKNKGDLKVSYLIKDSDKTSVKDYENGKVYEVSIYEQTFMSPEIELPKAYDFVFANSDEIIKKNEKAVAAAEKEYLPIDVILTATKKDEVKAKVEEVYTRLNELEDVRAKQTLTDDNFHDFVDEDLRWFMAAYLGPVNGWSTVYKYESKDSSVCEAYKAPSEGDHYQNCYLLTGAGSKTKIKEEMRKHLSDAVITNIDRRFITGTLGDLSDYAGDVYWMSEASTSGKAYDSLTAKDATFVGVNQDTGAVTVRWKLESMGYVTDNFTITLQQTDGDYQVISYTRSDR